MYNRRVSKCHPRVEAYGSVDELNAALGVARACNTHAFVCDHLLGIQNDLVIAMGELATAVEDLPRYEKDGFHRIGAEMRKKLDLLAQEIESQNPKIEGWATPGVSVAAASLDVARTICRRAERHVCALQETCQLQNDEVIVYFNRLADVLWLLARWEESRAQE
jgi:cob(I)alamin adenosyltransferase